MYQHRTPGYLAGAMSCPLLGCRLGFSHLSVMGPSRSGGSPSPLSCSMEESAGLRPRARLQPGLCCMSDAEPPGHQGCGWYLAAHLTGGGTDPNAPREWDAFRALPLPASGLFLLCTRDCPCISPSQKLAAGSSATLRIQGPQTLQCCGAGLRGARY
jgi:hypothetical protein